MLTQLDRLTFGRAVPDGSIVSDADWSDFETTQIASRFPSGYTVIHALGAWKDAATGRAVHEPSTIVEVASMGDEETRRALRAVATVYKTLFRQDAVMLSTVPVSVDFI